MTRHPYYVVAPSWVRTSAGIRVLHRLCDALNGAGERAFMVVVPWQPEGRGSHAEMRAPLLTGVIARRHYDQGLSPIAVYPETVRGNPLGTPVVARYVLNYPSLLGGDPTYPPSELIFGYSRRLARAAGAPENVLFLLVCDTGIFRPGPATPRAGSCFWAAKHRRLGAALSQVTSESVEITKSHSPEEIARLFRRSEVFYTYENTALAIEATLCGTPAVFLPNPNLTEIIACEELGWDGYAWGTDPKELARAKATVTRAHVNYRRAAEGFAGQLGRFVAATQERAAQAPCVGPVNLEFQYEFGWERIVRKVAVVGRRKGLRRAARKAVAMIRFRRMLARAARNA